ncbi:PepSY-associated TM helix domain-containing protein [Bordetella petrii]|uniref:PepSY-associated TM helix domain-containing protein n=1 Tax=Bordetella petrii TaxID=94624 RepID=UPI001E64A3BA|nr:PepSY-associated TM helix domain-containing protein [Bordetella petrii]MCD0504588.1 PepSY domain-containing protein [Bordetella petrii]
MKEGLRQCMAWLHTWTGLVAGWVLFFVFVTGTAGYFAFEIDRWMQPELPLAAAPLDQARAIGQAQAYLQEHHARAEFWNIGVPVERTQPHLSLFVRDPRKPDGTPGRTHRAAYDAASGQFVASQAVRDTGGGQFLYRTHYLLHYLPEAAGIWIVGICTMLMLVALISGAITHKKIFTDFYTFRPGKGQRSWLDAHNLSSVMALPFFLMITYSGLVFFMDTYMPAGVRAAYGGADDARRRLQAELIPANFPRPAGQPAPLASLRDIARQAEAMSGIPASGILVRNPGDAAATVTIRVHREGQPALAVRNLRFNGVTGQPLPPGAESAALQTRNTLLALHEGRFAAPALRWLYFLSGLLGCAMIATGLVLWTAKRKARQDKLRKAGGRGEFGYGLVRCLNIGTIAGLPVAVAAYFWANRLIPADLASRRAWEAHALFITWALLLAYPAIRRSPRAWVDEFRLAALACGLLPLINALTTQRHLGITLPAGNWVLAGFDLVMLALGLLFAGIALKLGKACHAS